MAMGGIVLLLVAGAVLDSVCGRSTALRYVYGAPWTIALWAVAVVFGISYLVHERRRGQISLSAFFVHMSFPVILAGGVISHIFGREGVVELSAGEPTALIRTGDEAEEELPFMLVMEDTAGSQEDGVRIVILKKGDYSAVAGDSGLEGVVRSFKEGVTGRAESSYGDLPSFSPSAMRVYSDTEVLRSGTVSRGRRFLYKGWRMSYVSCAGDAVTLMLRYDPVGVCVTYLGYILMCVTMCVYLLSGRKRRHHHHHHHHHRYTHEYLGVKKV